LNDFYDPTSYNTEDILITDFKIIDYKESQRKLKGDIMYLYIKLRNFKGLVNNTLKFDDEYTD